MKKLNSLQSLRFLAFLSVFFLHIDIKFLLNSGWGVSFFITLSGFLYGYKYYDKNCSYNYIKKFTLSKIKKFYPLHLIMLIASIPLSEIFIVASKNDYTSITLWTQKILTNIFLIQDYYNIKEFYYAFNGVSWFLSLMVFLTILTIPLIIFLKFLNKNSNCVKLFLLMAGIMAIDYVYVLYVRNNSLDITYWLYIFPPSRIAEYLCGLITGFIIRNMKDSTNIKNYTLLEVLSIIVLFTVQYFAIYEWQCRGIVWIIPNVFLIGIFSFEKGRITKLLDNRLLVWLGNISFEAFLIHQVIIRYFNVSVPIDLSENNKLCAEIYIFILTIIISNFIHSKTQKATQTNIVCHNGGECYEK